MAQAGSIFAALLLLAAHGDVAPVADGATAAWRAYLAAPDDARAEQLAERLERGERIDGEVDLRPLDREVRRGSAGAIRLAFALHTAYGAHLSEESGVIAGRGIDSNPGAFAKSLDRYFPKLGRVGGVCASFGDAFVDRPSATAAEARRRRDALSRSLGSVPSPAARLCLDALEALGRTGD